MEKSNEKVMQSQFKKEKDTLVEKLANEQDSVLELRKVYH
jgi:hypothetical protein